MNLVMASMVGVFASDVGILIAGQEDMSTRASDECRAPEDLRGAQAPEGSVLLGLFVFCY